MAQVAMPKVPSLSSISPSSTMDLLPTQQPARRLRAKGAHHTLDLTPQGKATALGSSSLEEEGEVFIAHLGTSFEWGEPIVQAREVLLPENAGACVEVAAGNLHSLFLCEAGAIFSCGGGWEGPLGHGDEGTLAVPRPIAALAHVHVERIAAGAAHSLAVASGGLWSWGWSRHGQCGHGEAQSILSPRRVEDLERVVQVAAGDAHSLALCSDGGVYSFGKTTAGQCGHGLMGPATPPLRRPARVLALAEQHVHDVLASADASAALVAAPGGATSELYHWGMLPTQLTSVAAPVRGSCGGPMAGCAGPGA